ncbi:hypothetical protein [Catellatospora methionotrophica]|uniref:hypothetical protein n=1 Tax=Catellatospora methionotrophica TaxID=121620 RepID=UPI0033E9C34F
MSARMISVHQVLRYAQGASRTDIQLDGYPNYHFLTSPPSDVESPKLMLEKGINAAAPINGGGNVRRPLIGIRSSPWKAGHESNPWHDVFYLDHGHVRYYGDHKVTTVGLPGATVGNQALLEAWPLHAATTADERRKAPPLLMYRSVTVKRAGKTIVKGHVECCGVAIIERIEHVVQRDATTGSSFPNLVLDLAVFPWAPQIDVNLSPLMASKSSPHGGPSLARSTTHTARSNLMDLVSMGCPSAGSRSRVPPMFPRTAVDGRTQPDTPIPVTERGPDRSCWSEPRLCCWWRVEDSNL